MLKIQAATTLLKKKQANNKHLNFSKILRGSSDLTVLINCNHLKVNSALTDTEKNLHKRKLQLTN